jgi:hypothetical protein
MIRIVEWISNIALLSFWLAVAAASAFLLVVLAYTVKDYICERCIK